jgi:hypothetical protein
LQAVGFTAGAILLKNRQKCSKIVKNVNKTKKMRKIAKKQQKSFILPINHLTYYMTISYNNPQVASLVSPLHFHIGNSELDIGYSTLFFPIPYTLSPGQYILPILPAPHKICFRNLVRGLSCLKNSVNIRNSLSKRHLHLYICRDPSTNPTFLCKTNPILCVFSPKTTISPKNKPKTNPNEPNFDPKMICELTKQTQTNPNRKVKNL